MFTITGFADELDKEFEVQMKYWKKMGLSWFELRSAWGVNVMDLTDDQIRRIKDIIDPIGVRVSCIGSPIGKTYIEDPPEFEEKRLARAACLAHYFGCSRVRVFSFYSRSGNILDFRDEVMKRLRAMSDYAKAQGIVLLHENEAHIYGELSRESSEIAATLRSDHFGLVFDPANYSVAGEDALDAEKNMHPYISYVHVKDYAGHDLDMSIPGQGVSHIPEVFERLKDRDLFVSMEPHLDVAGQFGGFTAPDKYAAAVSAVRSICDRLGIRWT